MITKCKKCGCDTLIKNGEWYECPMCGAMMFDTSIFVGKIESPTKTLEMIDEGKVTATAQISKPFSIDAEENHEEKTFESTIEKAENTTQEKPKKKKHTKKKAIEKSEKQEVSKLKEAISFMTPIVIALIVAILLKTFIFANAVVPTGSMINTIQEGDRIIASRLAYINEDPKRYDVIIFHYPDDESQLFVKRIIGMPGETINIKNGIVYITDASGNTTEARSDFACRRVISAHTPFRLAVTLLWGITEMTAGMQDIGRKRMLKRKKLSEKLNSDIFRIQVKSNNKGETICLL